MNKEQNLKAYAIVVMVKPTNNGAAKYKPRIYKGITIAQSPAKAKDRTIKMLLEQHKSFDGSSITKPLITQEHLIIKKCELHDDFFLSQHEED